MALPLAKRFLDAANKPLHIDRSTNVLVATHEDMASVAADLEKQFNEAPGRRLLPIARLGEPAPLETAGTFQSFVGPQNKKKILKAIEDLPYNPIGTNIIVFDGHGGPQHFWLTNGELGHEVSDSMHIPEAIVTLRYLKPCSGGRKNAGIMMISFYR